MNKLLFSSIFSSIVFSLLLTTSFFGQTNFYSTSPNSIEINKIVRGNDLESFSSSTPSRKPAFLNPSIFRFENGCSAENVNAKRFDKELSIDEQVAFCEALQGVSVELNNNAWSPELKAELQEVWKVFLTQNVNIRPMKKGMSKRIVAAAEAFTSNQKGSGFNATLYLRPTNAKKKSFFLFTMHELRHVFDFYQLWKKRKVITQSEFEKRGFRIMGKIASETKRKESFFRLPQLWNDKWKKLSNKEIEQKREAKIESYMQKSRFYKHLVKNPNKHIVGFSNSVSLEQGVNSADIKKGKGERLPYLVKVNNSTSEVSQKIQNLSFTPEKAIDDQNADELLRAALVNESNLYRKMDNFVYDQSLDLRCWKKQRVVETLYQSMQVTRTTQGKVLSGNENTKISSKKKKRLPSCILSLDSIETDATETFWSAPYLNEMQVKFDYFTDLDGIPVARYTVYKPTKNKFEQIAEKYPFVKPFRVFFGSIFVSVKDAQIIKFWGSSYPNATTTGVQSSEVVASYNATAVREKLASGIWVTTKIDTVAVANKRGKMRPFNYIVNYKNYRQSTSDVVILDDEDYIDSDKNKEIGK